MDRVSNALMRSNNDAFITNRELEKVQATVKVQDKRIRDLEEDNRFLKTSYDELSVSVNNADCNSIALEARVKDLEGKWGWLNSELEEQGRAFEGLDVRMERLEESQQSASLSLSKLHQSHKDVRNGVWDVLGRFEREQEDLGMRVWEVEQYLMREIHCSHCWDLEPINESRMSGWRPRRMRTPGPEGEESESGSGSEVIGGPILPGTPHVGVLGLEYASESESSESSGPSVIPNTSRATSPDENVVPLPVVRGVIRSPVRDLMSPFYLPPASSTSQRARASRADHVGMGLEPTSTGGDPGHVAEPSGAGSEVPGPFVYNVGSLLG